MADSIHIYAQYMASLMNKEIDWDSDTFALMLCSSSYTPNQTSHRYKSSVTNEITGDGYTAGGKELENVTVTYDSGNLRYTVDADPVSWEDASFSAKYGVLYNKAGGSDAARALVLYITFDPVREPENGSFDVIWNPSGIFRFSVVTPS